jgi:alpha-D-ribose 1-methylphosphonate 5-triphosphate synthase subunit PhnH
MYSGLPTHDAQASFAALLAALLPGLDWELLRRANFAALPRALPVLVLSLVFHNVVSFNGHAFSRPHE